MRRIAAHYTLIGSRLERNMIVDVDSSRRIVAIEQVSALDNHAGVEFYPGILIPGMVNLHCHLELSYLHNKIAERSGFAGFAREIGALRNNFTHGERRHAASVADSTMWEEGIEAVLDIANDELIMDIKRRSNIKYETLFEVFGLGCSTVDNHRNMAKHHDSSSITPHSTYSLQDKIFRESAHDNTSTISLHLLESDDEIELYDSRGSLAEWYRRMGWECDFLHYGSPARRVIESIDADRRVVLAHGCKATKEDITMLNMHFTNDVTWALCPESNRYISDSKPPVELFRSMGAHIALGTDSLASARSLSLIDNMRLIEDVPLTEMLQWVTINGAKALGMEHTLGEIAIGKTPGLVLLESIDLHNLSLTSTSRSRRIL